MELSERIGRYLCKVPPAISGQQGHNQTFSITCALMHGFNLTEDETLYWLQQYNVTCKPPWSESELLHKVRQAAKEEPRKPRGWLLGDGPIPKHFTMPATKPPPQHIDPTTCIENFLKGFRCNEHELYEASPVKPSHDFTQDGILLLENLYQSGENINYVTDYKNSATSNGSKAIPSGYGITGERDGIINEWAVNGMPESNAGGWIRMNPTDADGIADKNIVSFRFVLLEFDNIPIDLQLSLFSRLAVPIAVILTSGGKSCHAWVKVDCSDVDDYRNTSVKVLQILGRFGLDAKNKNPSRLSRLPGVTRVDGASGDGRQRILYLNPEPIQKAILCP